MMRLVLLGPPGCGKGTQGAVLKQRLGVSWLSTGDLLRAEVESGSERGKELGQIMASGGLVADDIVLALVKDFLASAQGKGFVLDGFPRTVVQAQGLSDVLAAVAAPLDYAVYFSIEPEILLGRVENRARESGAAAVRADDTPEAMRHRLEVYFERTLPLVEWYRARGKLVEVDAAQSIDNVTKLILSKIGVAD